MSNIYITEPNTEGKVLLHTTFGDLDIELWPQQAPKACRNFVQLCLERYYDNTPFHRIISGFMVQGGDPTGTGKGGESIYGGAFIDEFHSRLRFNHRGLLAMANENKPNSNHSQFFFTLDACEFLEKKHTIFGKITGNTIFNLLSIGDIETDKNDRPLNPPKFLSAEVLWNPFDDIVPRTIKKATTIDNVASKKKTRKATKNLNLLSFGDEEEESMKTSKKITIASSHDLLQDRKLSKKVDETVVQSIKEAVGLNNTSKISSSSKPKESAEKKLSNFKARIEAAMEKKEKEKESKEEIVMEQHKDNDSEEKKAKKEKKKRKAEAQNEKDEYTKLREELRKNRSAANVIVGEKAKELDKAKAYHDMLTPLQQQRQKYLAKKKSSNATRQSDTLKKLAAFQQTLSQASQEARTKGEKSQEYTSVSKESYHGQVFSEDSGEENEEKDDKSWMTAKLKFKKHIDDQYRAGFDPSADDYMTIDTRTTGDSAAIKKDRDYNSRDRRDRSQREGGRRREYDRERERR